MCNHCAFKSKDFDDVAIHLMDAHGYAFDQATAWLRKEVENDEE